LLVPAPAAAARLPERLFHDHADEISLASADGVELLRHDGRRWRWRDGEMRSELDLLAFFVTFRFGARIVTIAVSA